jgi:hypothetical protein
MIDWTLPIRLISPNVREQWILRYKRNKKLHTLLLCMWQSTDTSSIKLPCKVTITRFCARPFDHDNFLFSCKFIRDEISGFLRPEKARGHADGDGMIKFEYRQEKGKGHSLRIQVSSLDGSPSFHHLF